MTCCALTKEDALAIWPQVEHLIKQATDLDNGRSNPEFIKGLIEQDKAVLWLHHKLGFVWVTSIEEYPTGLRACQIRVGAGSDLDVCREAFETVVKYARKMNCTLVEVFGRRGWLRVIPGLHEETTIMSRTL